ncbi:MAG TPA: ParB/RepB/Spo0J family partition protein [Nitrososphaeraceae archaeon]|nr:ParB/RepB/Spo0J family partition protein [Nitrososphaeraceae archaeon]
MATIEFKTIPIDEIIEPEWDIRKDMRDDYYSDNSDLNGLVQSIKKDGVIQPIIVSKIGIDKYQIIAGRRRFKACKILKLKEIPAGIKLTNTYDKNDKQRIALIENLHRKDLSDIEKADGILSVYTNAGYQSEDVVRFIKYLENNGYQPGKTDRSLILGNNSLTKSNIKSKREHIVLDEQFLDIVDSIGYSPNTQYKYLQIAVKLDPSILKEAEEKGLSINKKIMLTNTKLREFPELERILIDKIANQSDQAARTIISETVRLIENDKVTKEKLLELERKIKELEQSEDPWHITMSEDLEGILRSLETKEFLKKANTNREYQDLKASLLKQKTEKGYPLQLVKRSFSPNNELINVYEGLYVAKDIIYPIIFTCNLRKKDASTVIDEVKKEKIEQQFNLR